MIEEILRQQVTDKIYEVWNIAELFDEIYDAFIAPLVQLLIEAIQK